MDDDSSLIVWLLGRSVIAKSEILKAKVRRSKGVIAMSSFICSSLMAAGDVILALFMTEINKKGEYSEAKIVIVPVHSGFQKRSFEACLITSKFLKESLTVIID
jgi:hypothetical protein